MVHGKKMNVVGNNIANVSTLGFKAQRMDFCDYLYVSGGSVSGPTQIGQGAGVYAVLGDFSQGSFESTNTGTDVAIDGNGFFRVRQPKSEMMYYTRAGDFYFDKDRQLINPQKMLLQGWEVDNTKDLTFNRGATSIGSVATHPSPYVGSGAPKDIVLESWNLPPEQTRSVSFTMQLSNDSNTDRTTNTKNPMSALFEQWDGTAETPLADNAYAAQSSINVYDAGGRKHTLTVYYDRVATETSSYTLKDLPAGYTVYEYLVTIPPSEDMRTYGGTVKPDSEGNPLLIGGTKFSTTKKAGVLMTGQLIFNQSGQLVNQTAFTYGAGDTPAADTPCNLNPTALASWQPTRTSSNGLPVFVANFSGTPLSNTVSETASNGGTAYSIAEKNIIELDFGLKNTANTPWKAGSATSLAGLTVQGGPPGTIAYDTAVPTMASVERQNSASILTSGKATIRDSDADGYPVGILNGYKIDPDGVLYGTYDNNQTLALYQIALYDFDNLQGLYREGNNLYSETNESGRPRQGVPNHSGFGATRSYNIEQSNVDLAREFVQMISTQRGFQANSKGITTVDTMLETVIGMKR